MEKHNGKYACSKRARARPYRAGTAAFARREFLAGVVAFWYPGMTTLVLLMFIAVWAIIIGATQIWGAIALRRVLQNEWLLIINGALSIAFGVILMVQPGAGALAVAWMIAWYAIFFGCLYIALAFQLRQYKRA